MKRWLVENFGLLLIYSVFIFSGSLYLRGVIRYRYIKNWPSVPAEIVDAGGQLNTVSRDTKFGSTTIAIDSRFIEFRYVVAGESYSGIKVTPDGGGLPVNPTNLPLRAYYDPKSPETAVLNPIPFQGTGLLFAAFFSGIVVAVHLGVTVLPMAKGKRRADSDFDSGPDPFAG
ncbi:MAG: DUF3592 domain-containing protein [Verrucomicrobiae bacterium]|nr:DUF3592 domain-containing protein [Verrucomicrobiae bacterium]MCB1090165.1 DUF3592 domain-containing protein [Verrucomicrobiae bacterium]